MSTPILATKLYIPPARPKVVPRPRLIERLNEEFKRRTYVVRIFPNAASCCRLVRALAVETHENWLEAHRYINMDDLKEHKKAQLRQAALVVALDKKAALIARKVDFNDNDAFQRRRNQGGFHKTKVPGGHYS